MIYLFENPGWFPEFFTVTVILNYDAGKFVFMFVLGSLDVDCGRMGRDMWFDLFDLSNVLQSFVTFFLLFFIHVSLLSHSMLRYRVFVWILVIPYVCMLNLKYIVFPNKLIIYRVLCLLLCCFSTILSNVSLSCGGVCPELRFVSRCERIKCARMVCRLFRWLRVVKQAWG